MKITESQLKTIIFESTKTVLNEIKENNRKSFPSDERINVSHYSENSYLVPITETNAKRMLARHSDNGYIVISPCRSNPEELGINPNDPNVEEKSKHINNERVKDFINILRKKHLSYTPVYGGFIENLGSETEKNVYEKSFMVYNRTTDGNVFGIDKLYDFGIEMSKKYNQDSFLFKKGNENPKYITKNGEIDMEFGSDATFNDFSQEYFTDLHKNSEKYKNNGGKPTRFTFVESYVNPPCGSISSRAPRSAKGEVFIY